MHNSISNSYALYLYSKNINRRRVVRLVLHRIKSPFWPSIHKIIDFIYWKSDVEFNFLQFGIFFLFFWQKKRPIRRGRKKVPNTVRFFQFFSKFIENLGLSLGLDPIFLGIWVWVWVWTQFFWGIWVWVWVWVWNFFDIWVWVWVLGPDPKPNPETLRTHSLKVWMMACFYLSK